MEKRSANWILYDNGGPRIGVKCSKCGMVINSSDIIFGRVAYDKCPGCNTENMELSDDVYTALQDDCERDGEAM